MRHWIIELAAAVHHHSLRGQQLSDLGHQKRGMGRLGDARPIATSAVDLGQAAIVHERDAAFRETLA